jgi:hypothetical protein
MGKILEAIVNETGRIRLLTEIGLEKSRHALVRKNLCYTLLSGTSAISPRNA